MFVKFKYRNYTLYFSEEVYDKYEDRIYRIKDWGLDLYITSLAECVLDRGIPIKSRLDIDYELVVDQFLCGEGIKEVNVDESSI